MRLLGLSPGRWRLILSCFRVEKTEGMRAGQMFLVAPPSRGRAILAAPPLLPLKPQTTTVLSGIAMARPGITLLLLLLVRATACGAQPRVAQAKTELLNVCMNAKHHKEKPSPEDKLHEQVGWLGGWSGG